MRSTKDCMEIGTHLGRGGGIALGHTTTSGIGV